MSEPLITDQAERLIAILERGGKNKVNRNPTLEDQRRLNQGGTMIRLNRSGPKSEKPPKS